MNGWSLHLENNIKKLDAIAELQSNWDLHGAPEFEKLLIEFCKEKLYELEDRFSNIEKVQPEIFPTNNETIQFEFKNGSDWLEIEIPNDMSHIDYFMLKNGKETEQQCSLDELLKVVGLFYG